MIRILYFALLLVISYIHVTLISAQCTSRVIINFERTVLPSGYQFVSLYTPSRFQCAQYCYNFIICKSMQYNSRDGLCELNVMHGFDLGYTEVTDHMEFASRGGISKAIAGSCADHNCDVYSMCVDSNGRFSCVQQFRRDKECFLPVPVSYISPPNNLTSVPIGSVVTSICNFPLMGTFSATCKPNGEWALQKNACAADFCYEVYAKYVTFNQGGYTISTHDGTLRYRLVYCNNQDKDWLIFQHRPDIKEEVSGFERFKHTDEKFIPYWLERAGDIQNCRMALNLSNYRILTEGNEVISFLTNYKEVELRVEFTVSNGSTVYYAEYGQFSITEGDYSLNISDYKGGNCGDGLSDQDGSAFKEMDDGRGGWWQRENSSCTNLNADGLSDSLRWTTDCPGNNTQHWTGITSTKLMMKRVKKPWE